MAHHSSTLTQLITSSVYEKKGHFEPDNDEMHAANAHTLPFAEKVGDGRHKNRPIWQPKIIYPTTLM